MNTTLIDDLITLLGIALVSAGVYQVSLWGALVTAGALLLFYNLLSRLLGVWIHVKYNGPSKPTPDT